MTTKRAQIDQETALRILHALVVMHESPSIWPLLNHEEAAAQLRLVMDVIEQHTSSNADTPRCP